MLPAMLIFKIMLKIIIVTLIAGLLLLGSELIKFYHAIPDQPTIVAEKTDAIIVLTGGSERISEAIKLLNHGYGAKLLISGVGKDTKLSELLAEQPMPQAEKNQINYTKVAVGREAINTVGNAREAADWVSENNIKSIYLVTASYHMPRALVEFRKQMPDLKIIPYPVFPADFTKTKWREKSKSRNYILKEYFKYLAAMIGK